MNFHGSMGNHGPSHRSDARVIVWGLHLIDLAIVVFFLVAILGVGVWVSRGVKHEGDFYLGGRKLGRVLQFFLNFGNSTDSTGAVSTSTEVYRQGAGGMWIGFQTLFITPFFWFTQPWYRRSRLVTMADLFIDRFDSRGLASAYAAFNILIALITLGMGNLAAYKVCSAMIVKDPATYTTQEKQTVADFEEYRALRSRRLAGTMPESFNDRFRLLDDLNAHRKLRSSITYIREIPFTSATARSSASTSRWAACARRRLRIRCRACSCWRCRCC
jgi:hypothetical protein